MTTEATTPSSARNVRAPDRADTYLSELAGDPDMTDLIRSFVDEIPERIRLVERFWDTNQFDDLRRIAHQLKGACGGYGFPKVGEAAANLENNLSGDAAADLDAVARRVRELVEMCRRVRAS